MFIAFSFLSFATTDGEPIFWPSDEHCKFAVIYECPGVLSEESQLES